METFAELTEIEKEDIKYLSSFVGSFMLIIALTDDKHEVEKAVNRFLREMKAQNAYDLLKGCPDFVDMRSRLITLANVLRNYKLN